MTGSQVRVLFAAPPFLQSKSGLNGIGLYFSEFQELLKVDWLVRPAQYRGFGLQRGYNDECRLIIDWTKYHQFAKSPQPDQFKT